MVKLNMATMYVHLEYKIVGENVPNNKLVFFSSWQKTKNTAKPTGSHSSMRDLDKQIPNK